MPKKLLIVNPWIEDFAAYDLWSKPMGLLYLGAVLERNGFEVSLIDCLDRWDSDILAWQGIKAPKQKKNGTGKYYREAMAHHPVLSGIKRQFSRYGFPEQVFLSKLRDMEKPDAVLVGSGMTYWYPSSAKVIRHVKKEWPDVPVLLGGVYVTLMEEHARKNSGADFVVPGTDMSTILEAVCEAAGCSVKQPDVPGSFDDYPTPQWKFYRHFPYISVFSSLGCPYRCSFCASSLVQKKFMERSPDKTVREIITLAKRYGLRNIAFFDDALFVNSERRMIPVMEALASSGLKLYFHTPNGLHAAHITSDVAYYMRRSGFSTIRLSLETTSVERRDEISGKVTPESYTLAVVNLQAAGYPARQIEAYVLVGLPDEHPKEIIKSVIFIIQTGVRVRLTRYSPIPGTKDFEKAVRMGFDPDSDPLLHNNTIMAARHPEFTDEIYLLLNDLITLSNTLTMNGIDTFIDRKWNELMDRIWAKL